MLALLVENLFHVKVLVVGKDCKERERQEGEEEFQGFTAAIERRGHQDIVPTCCALLEDHVSYFERIQFSQKLVDSTAEILPSVVMQDVFAIVVLPS